MAITPATCTSDTETLSRVATQVAGMIRMPLVWLIRYYSSVLERRVSIRQTLLLINAQTAFVFAVFPADGPLVLRIACGAWLLHAVLWCRRAL